MKWKLESTKGFVAIMVLESLYGPELTSERYWQLLRLLYYSFQDVLRVYARDFQNNGARFGVPCNK